MHRPSRALLLCSLSLIVLHGCAAQPRETSTAPVTPPEPVVQEPVAPPPPPGVPMDISTQPAAEPISLWTRVRTEGQLNLATGAQLVSIQLRGEAEVEPPLIVVRRPPHWRVTEALDQDGQPIQYRSELDGGGTRTDIRALEYAQTYVASLRGDAPRRLPIELQLTDLPQRPRIIRKLSVVGEVPAIRGVETRLIDVPTLGEAVAVAPGVVVTVEESQSLDRHSVAVTLRIDPLLPEMERPLVVGVGLVDAEGHAADAAAVDDGESPGTMTFRLVAPNRLVPPLRLRLMVASDVGPEQITCVARDIPIP